MCYYGGTDVQGCLNIRNNKLLKKYIPFLVQMYRVVLILWFLYLDPPHYYY
jgi:hypothetical protein